jgi:hypothetical protein
VYVAIHRVRLNIRYILDYNLAVFKLNTFIKSRLVVNCTLFNVSLFILVSYTMVLKGNRIA